MTDDPVSAIRNLGPAAVTLYARAGLTSAGQVRAIGAEETYRRLLAAGHRPHFIAFTALVLGLQGRAWNDMAGQEKAALRLRFDALTRGAAHAPERAPDPAPDRTAQEGRSRLEAALDELGVRAPPGHEAGHETGGRPPLDTEPGGLAPSGGELRGYVAPGRDQPTSSRPEKK